MLKPDSNSFSFWPILILNIKLTIVSNVMWVYWDEKTKATHLWKDMKVLVPV